MILGALLAVLLQSAAPASQVDQIPGADAPRALTSPTAQIGRPIRRVDPAPRAPLSTDASQLNGQARSARAPDGPRPPARMRANLDPVSGADRCDPAQEDTAASELCARAIETRAGEFTPPPTPEARLLADVDDLSSVDADRAARRLAEGDPRDSEVAQAVAYQSVLAANPPPQPKAISPETQRAIDLVTAIIGASAAGPPR